MRPEAAAGDDDRVGAMGETILVADIDTDADIDGRGVGGLMRDT